MPPSVRERSTLSACLQVKVEDFLAAARQRWERGSSRQRALRYISSLLDTKPVGLGLRHLVLAVGQILREGIRWGWVPGGVYVGRGWGGTTVGCMD